MAKNMKEKNEKSNKKNGIMYYVHGARFSFHPFLYPASVTTAALIQQ